jgi:3-phosphoshikimate 1-carboxyvinyltransferase
MRERSTLIRGESADPLPVVHLGTGARFDVSVTPPGSKSITNRALLLAALAPGESVLRHALTEADDTHRMIAALSLLGAGIERERDSTVRVRGVGGRWKPAQREVHLDLGNAGTATRFLAAAAVLSPVSVIIDGNPRMRQRPIGELTGALASLGATIQHLGTPDCPPVRIVPPAFELHSPKIEFGPLKSSQFVSSLLLIAPWIPGGLTIRHTATVTSPSYVWMSLRLLERLGASVQNSDDLRVIRVGSPAADEAAPRREPRSRAVRPHDRARRIRCDLLVRCRRDVPGIPRRRPRPRPRLPPG